MKGGEESLCPLQPLLIVRLPDEIEMKVAIMDDKLISREAKALLADLAVSGGGTDEEDATGTSTLWRRRPVDIERGLKVVWPSDKSKDAQDIRANIEETEGELYWNAPAKRLPNR